MLIPAGVASAVSYLAFVTLAGTDPLFGVAGSPPFDLVDLAGAAVLGVLCGLGARLFALGVDGAKRVAAKVNPFARATVAGALLGVFALLAHHLFGRALTLGAGYDTLAWAFDPSRTVALVLGLLVLRTAATITTVAGGGVGGLLIPLVIEGTLLGRTIGGLFRTSTDTGRPGFIVPGLIATMVAQLFMGPTSVSAFQARTRADHPEE